MASALAQLKQEWRAFKNDDPGGRFEHHHDRMHHRSRAFVIGTLVLGIVLLAAGIVLCVIPGPGSPLIVFGLALIGARFRPMAHLLDRAEIKLRKAGRHVKRHWKGLPGHSVIIGLTALAAAGSLFMWRFVVSAYLLE